MHYISVDEAKNRPGLKIAVVQGMPSPWGESVKAICALKDLEFAAIAQSPRQANAELVAWTGHRNAPVVIYDNEDPRTGWAEILFLLERLAPEPRLIPADAADRALMFGLSHEIAGEDGLGWNRRLSLVAASMASGKPPMQADPQAAEEFVQLYGVNRGAIDRADARTADILTMLSDRLESQQSNGSDYFIGNSLSAADVYFCYFSQLLAPLAQEHCPLKDTDRPRFESRPPLTDAALTPALIAHRDRIFHQFLPLPMDFS